MGADIYTPTAPKERVEISGISTSGKIHMMLINAFFFFFCFSKVLFDPKEIKHFRLRKLQTVTNF